MAFLYSLNRLNVATSRARCVALVVASPALVTVACHTPRQMQLANALCRFVEMAGHGPPVSELRSSAPPREADPPSTNGMGDRQLSWLAEE